MPSVDLIVGARPNFMKVASIISAINDGNSRHRQKLHYRLIHTGQHYSRNMSKVFFSDLGIPEPNINLEVGSGSHAEQTGEIMKRYEGVLKESDTNICIVLGNAGSREDIPALQIVAAGEDPVVAEHAEWAIEQLKSD